MKREPLNVNLKIRTDETFFLTCLSLQRSYGKEHCTYRKRTFQFFLNIRAVKPERAEFRRCKHAAHELSVSVWKWIEFALQDSHVEIFVFSLEMPNGRGL